jgi:hypothetical protein
MRIFVQIAAWFFLLVGFIFAVWMFTVAKVKQSWSGIGGAVLMEKSLMIFWCTTGIFVGACVVLALARPASRKEMVKAALLAAAGGIGSFLVLFLGQ